MDLLQKSQVDETSYLAKQKKVLDEKFQHELRKARDQWLAQEKRARTKWEQDKVAEIRAQTVKGLEPEIQRIVERNKDELRKAHTKHAEEVTQTRGDLLQEQDSRLYELRQRLVQDREEAIEREREKTQQKLDALHERLTLQFEQERHKWREAQQQAEVTPKVQQAYEAEIAHLKQELASMDTRCKV